MEGGARYTTALGTRFYDREWELGKLAEALEEYRTLVVYGPRNVGKSELLRYFLRVYAPGRLGSLAVVAVDARERAAETLGLGGWAREAVRLASRIIAEALGAPGSLPRLVERLASLLARLRASKTIIYIDEYHLLYHDRARALLELESVAGFLAKRGREDVNLVLTVSEGFAATREARRRLLGYSAGFLLVEGLDRDPMGRLFEEYSRIHGCRLGFRRYWSVYGGAPGYLVEACKLDWGRLLAEKLPETLYHAVDAALEELAAALGVGRRALIERVAGLFEKLYEGVAPEAGETGLAERLVEYNVLYPCWGRLDGRYTRLYLPQLPVYAAAVAAAAERGLDSVSGVPPEVLEEQLASREWSVTCRRLLSSG